MTTPEIEQFEDAGCVTIDTPLTREEIAAASEAMDRLLPFAEGNYRPSRTCDYFDAALVDIIQHPFFEAVAKTGPASGERPFLPDRDFDRLPGTR